MVIRIKQHWQAGVAGQNDSPKGRPSAILVGAPDDRGVLNVGGRLGAGHGPQAVRSMLGSFMLGIEGAIGRVNLLQGRDLEPGDSIEAGHRAVRGAVSQALKKGIIPIVLGGGHDYGYPHFGGVVDALGAKVGLINVDAHLDVRPPTEAGITSGSPFYLAIEEGVLKPQNFTEFGIQEHCNAEEFGRWLNVRKANIVLLDDCRRGRGPVENLKAEVERLAKRGLKTVVSFDVDAVAMAHAPGVSAPQSDGFTPAELLAMAKFCGECSDVASIGFFELAPPLDENQKTTRLVATALHRFLSGLSRRGESRKKKTTNRVARLLRRRR